MKVNCPADLWTLSNGKQQNRRRFGTKPGISEEFAETVQITGDLPRSFIVAFRECLAQLDGIYCGQPNVCSPGTTKDSSLTADFRICSSTVLPLVDTGNVNPHKR